MKFRKGYKYQLSEPCAIRVGLLGYKVKHEWFALEDGVLYIKRHFCWDGSTGVEDTKSSMRASAAHDCLYQMLREGLLPQHRRKRCDKVYVDLCKEDGMTKFRSWIRLKGLFMFGRKSATGEPREILIAP